jgi:hypothetical protein
VRYADRVLRNGKRVRLLGSIVELVREFQAFADECLGWAKTDMSDRERGISIPSGIGSRKFRTL